MGQVETEMEKKFFICNAPICPSLFYCKDSTANNLMTVLTLDMVVAITTRLNEQGPFCKAHGDEGVASIIQNATNPNSPEDSIICRYQVEFFTNK